MNLRINGTKNRSYKGIRTNMNSKGIIGREGPGILNPRMFVFMVVLCCMLNV